PGLRFGAEQERFDVAHAQPRHSSFGWPDGGQRHDHAACLHEGGVATAEKRDWRLLGVAFQYPDSELGRGQRLWTVADPVHHCQQHAIAKRFYQVEISGNGLAKKSARRKGPGNQRWRNGDLGLHLAPHRSFSFWPLLNHFFMVTVVPWPTLETISNSSIKSLAPGRPTPRPLREE